MLFTLSKSKREGKKNYVIYYIINYVILRGRIIEHRGPQVEKGIKLFAGGNGESNVAIRYIAKHSPDTLGFGYE